MTKFIALLATVFGTVDRTWCFWNITLSGLVYYYLDLVGGVVEYLGDLFAGNRWTPRTFSHWTVVYIGRSGMTYRYRTLEYGVCLVGPGVPDLATWWWRFMHPFSQIHLKNHPKT